jgi:protein-disulfide isomerase
LVLLRSYSQLLWIERKLQLKSVAKLFFLISLASSVDAEQVTNLIEFFSFTCSHCANVNQKVYSYVSKNNIQLTDISMDMSEEALSTTMMFYVAEDAGIGNKFKQAYFGAVSAGMPAYSNTTLNYVVGQIKTAKLTELLNSTSERQRVKDKLQYAAGLINKYQIQVTPTFVINNSTVLEGEEIINQLSQR